MGWDVAETKMLVAEDTSGYRERRKMCPLPQEALTPEDTEDVSVGMSYQRTQTRFRQLGCDFKARLYLRNHIIIYVL